MQVGRPLRSVLHVAAVVVLAACGADRSPPPPTIAFLGDSITYGIVRGPRGKEAAQVDPQGGYPGRLARRLDGRARVLNRGIGGATTGFWLSSPTSADGQAIWALIERAQWFDPTLVPRGESVAVAALAAVPPDVVVVLLGVNDLYMYRLQGPLALDTALKGVLQLARQAETVARTVLVATPLPNRRDPPALVTALTARIHAAFPEALPLGERFAALEWQELLADEVHPSPAGYEQLAIVLESLLVERGLVAPSPE